MKKFVIVGGGTAGWMTALVLANQWQQAVEVTLIESADVGIIGVGEGSTPALAMFFKTMRIDESEWMPECNATYKCGIRFEGWGGDSNASYFHPFPSRLDYMTQATFFSHAHARQQGADISVSPDAYYLTNVLAACGLAPIGNENFPFEIQYGYHFDAGLLGEFLKKKAATMGVHHKIGHVVAIENNDDGTIARLKTKDGYVLEADYFIDCSGFVSLLLQQHLKVPFISYEKTLFNNAAVTMPTPAEIVIPSETRATALTNGWAWKIPLTERSGNGYVYSTHFISANAAETELRTHLGLLDADVNVRHLKMNVGRVESHWAKNCLAVGLSQGFIEPLEATALFLVQQTLGLFVDALHRGNFTDQYRDGFNVRVNQRFDGVRDYIVAHYKMSPRQDSDYWRANTSDQENVSNAYRLFRARWQQGENLAELLQRPEFQSYYPTLSWYSLLMGLGYVMPAKSTAPEFQEKVKQERLGTLEFLRRCALNFKDQRAYLDELKKR